MEVIKQTKYLALLCTAALIPFSAQAHHSYAATFNIAVVNELEGEVTSVSWVNPHVLFELNVRDEQGKAELYQIESHSVSMMRGWGIDNSVIEVGDQLKVAGNPGRFDDKAMFVLNALLPNGEEVIFDPRFEPRWADQAMGTNDWQKTVEDAEAGQSGIFRVWSTSLADPLTALPFHENINPAAVERYPLTDAAREAIAAFDPITDSPTLNCAPKGMPAAMQQPYPMEIVQVGEDIHIRLEEYDGLRIVHMNSNQSVASQPRSLMGYSVGHWDGDTLVVETSRIDYVHFSGVGIPLGDDASTIERFTPTEDGKQLDYLLTVTNPISFTEPVELSKLWLALPGASVAPFVCEE